MTQQNNTGIKAPRDQYLSTKSSKTAKPKLNGSSSSFQFPKDRGLFYDAMNTIMILSTLLLEVLGPI
jgi:hypothetical protein